MACTRVINPNYEWNDNQRCFIRNVLPEIWTQLELLLNSTEEISRDANLSELISFCCRREYVAPLSDNFFLEYRHHLYKRLKSLDTAAMINVELLQCPGHRNRAKQLILTALPELQYSLQVHFNLPNHFLTAKVEEIVNLYEDRLKAKAAGLAIRNRMRSELGIITTKWRKPQLLPYKKP